LSFECPYTVLILSKKAGKRPVYLPFIKVVFLLFQLFSYLLINWFVSPVLGRMVSPYVRRFFTPHPLFMFQTPCKEAGIAFIYAFFGVVSS
jgi:hypothetical protein